MDCIERSKLTLLPHQRKVVQWLDQHRGIVAVHTTGSGKTLTAVTASQCFLDQNPGSSVVVLAPKSLLANFQKEMVRYGGLDPNDPRYHFYSFEKFFLEKNYASLCFGKMLIVDEAHMVRTEAATQTDISSLGSLSAKEEKEFRNRAQKIIECAKIAKRVLVLTATPFVNDPYDLANLVAMVKGISPPSKQEWKKMLEGPKKVMRSFLSDTFHFYSVQKTLANKYPEVRMHYRVLYMDDAFYEEYRKIEQQDKTVLEKYLIGKNPNAFLHGFRTALLKLPDNAKLQYTLKKIEEIADDSSKKMVIYSNFVDAGVNQVSNILRLHRIPYAEITGAMSANKRRKAVDAYNSGEKRILLLSKAGGTGIDLKATTQMIIMDIPWNPATLDQAIGRVARFESHSNLPLEKQKVDIYVLATEKPKALADAIRDKKELPSVDTIIRDVIEKKGEFEKVILELLKSLSI